MFGFAVGLPFLTHFKALIWFYFYGIAAVVLILLASVIIQAYLSNKVKWVDLCRREKERILEEYFRWCARDVNEEMRLTRARYELEVKQLWVTARRIDTCKDAFAKVQRLSSLTLLTMILGTFFLLLRSPSARDALIRAIAPF